MLCHNPRMYCADLAVSYGNFNLSGFGLAVSLSIPDFIPPPSPVPVDFQLNFDFDITELKSQILVCRHVQCSLRLYKCAPPRNGMAATMSSACSGVVGPEFGRSQSSPLGYRWFPLCLATTVRALKCFFHVRLKCPTPLHICPCSRRSTS